MINEANIGSTERVGFISDIHSQKKLFDIALKVIFEKNQCDRVVFVGDVIDRERNPNESIEKLQTIFDMGKKAVYIAGNHERDTLLQIYAPEIWEKNMEDHKKTHDLKPNYEVAKLLKQKRFAHLLEMLKGLPLYFENDDVFAVHSGLRDSSVEATKKELDDLLDDPANQGYCAYPIELMEGLKNDQEEGAVDSNKLIISGHFHRPGLSAGEMVGFNQRLRLGHEKGFLHIRTVSDDQQSLVTLVQDGDSIYSIY